MFNTKEKLSTSSIRKYVDDYSLIKYYFPEFQGIGKYKSNLRDNDTNHSLHFTSRNGKITVSDFGVPEFIGMTAYKYIQSLLGFPNTNIGYMESLGRIVEDFSLGEYIESFSGKEALKPSKTTSNRKPRIYNVRLENKQSTDIKIKARKWFSWNIDNKIWGIIADKQVLLPLLKLHKVKALEYYWINGIRFKVKKDNPGYSFTYNGQKKLYFPLDKGKYKWISNITNHKVLSLHTLTEDNYIVIEKSMKDLIVFKSLGYTNSIPMNSESMFIGKKYVEYLLSKYPRVLAHFDNDTTGIQNAEKFKSLYPELETFYFPIEFKKDNYAMIEHGRKQELINYFNKNLKI
jgi:hypothetical protein